MCACPAACRARRASRLLFTVTYSNLPPYGVYSHGLCSYDLHSYGLYIHGLCSHGLSSYSLACCVPPPTVFHPASLLGPILLPSSGRTVKELVTRNILVTATAVWAALWRPREEGEHCRPHDPRGVLEARDHAGARLAAGPRATQKEEPSAAAPWELPMAGSDRRSDGLMSNAVLRELAVCGSKRPIRGCELTAASTSQQRKGGFFAIVSLAPETAIRPARPPICPRIRLQTRRP